MHNNALQLNAFRFAKLRKYHHTLYMENVYMRHLLISSLLLVLVGCGGDPFWLPPAHRITIQQGNLLSERQLAKISVGMDQNSVRTLLGAPIANTLMHENRWDYLYTRGPAGAAIEAKRLAIFFEDATVARIDGNVEDTSGELPEHRNWWEKLFPPLREPTGL